MAAHLTHKKTVYILALGVCVACATVALGDVAYAQEKIGDFVPLSDGFGQIVNATGSNLETSTFSTFVNGIYKLAIRIAGAIAVAMFVWGGILYMVAPFGVAGEGLSKAKERMKNAVIGLLMLLTTWIIFNQINPDILNLTINQQPLLGTKPLSTEGSVEEGGTVGTITVITNTGVDKIEPNAPNIFFNPIDGKTVSDLEEANINDVGIVYNEDNTLSISDRSLMDNGDYILFTIQVAGSQIVSCPRALDRTIRLTQTVKAHVLGNKAVCVRQ